MKVIKKINNNVALAQDANGKDLVVFGKGIGFPPMPYHLNDLSKIQRTFYGIDSQYYDLVHELSEDVLSISGEITKQALLEIECEFNPNLLVTLADHLEFAVERVKKGMEFPLLLTADLESLYPKEMKLAKKTVALVKSRIGTELPESEVTAVAIHIINAEAENGDLHNTALVTELMGNILQIVERNLEIRIQTGSFNGSRFMSHLAYLVNRALKKEHINSNNAILFYQMKETYPDIYRCACHIAVWLEEKTGWKCNEEELLYLIIHINRVYYEG